MNFEHAVKRYAEVGVDAVAQMDILADVAVSIHCWQGDDVAGFDRLDGGAADGIQTTGNHAGRARNFDELTADFLFASRLIPGKKRISLHGSYAVFGAGQHVDRNRLEYKHFAPWVDFARRHGFGIDMNPTCFGHPMVRGGLTLSSPDKEVQRFWIDHCKAIRKIAAQIGDELGDTVLNNVWIPDGLKDTPADRLGPRERLRDALDEIFADGYPNLVDAVESKVFGIGLESYTVGSNEFYTAYAATHPGVFHLLDNGHFHPTESVADKISAMLPFFSRIPLHITRAVRWDSDHVVLFDDEIREIFTEVVRCGALERVHIGLDFFDASINRVAAWIVGARNAQKALLYALLQPHGTLKAMQDGGDLTGRLVLSEDCKTLPFGDIWQAYCEQQEVPPDGGWYAQVSDYEREVLLLRD